MKRYKVLFTCALILCVLFGMVSPMMASAKTGDVAQPFASYYLGAYSSYICEMGGGKLEIWFETLATGKMDSVGTLRIMVYESSDNVNWTWKKTFLSSEYPSMMAYNTNNHSDYVNYYGVPGRYYKAYVTIWAGKDGGGDTRYIWASPRKAT